MVITQHATADGVKRAKPGPFHGGWTGEGTDAKLELLGCVLREGDREDPTAAHTLLLQKVCHARAQYPRLAGPCTRKHQDSSLLGADCLSLHLAGH